MVTRDMTPAGRRLLSFAYAAGILAVGAFFFAVLRWHGPPGRENPGTETGEAASLVIGGVCVGGCVMGACWLAGSHALGRLGYRVWATCQRGFRSP